MVVEQLNELKNDMILSIELEQVMQSKISDIKEENSDETRNKSVLDCNINGTGNEMSIDTTFVEGRK